MSEEEKDIDQKSTKEWEDQSSKRRILDETSSGEESLREPGWIQRNFVNHLSRCCKTVKV